MRSSASSSWQCLAASLVAATTVLAAPALEQRALPSCRDFKIPVTASAINRIDITPPEDLANPTALVNFLTQQASAGLGGLLGTVGTAVTNGTFNMAVRYCEPLVDIPSRRNTIQYMQHAITMTKNYWSGLDFPLGFDGTKYSYIQEATEQGYPVIAIDNLGAGDSDKPDGLTVVQMTLQTAIAHELITMLRAGTVPTGGLEGKAFDKVIYVGHSYGSIQGNAIATNFPEDVDTFVLTGYSGEFALGLVPLAAGVAIPAALAMPDRFADLPPLYLAQTVIGGRQLGLYTVGDVGGFEDPEAVIFDFEHQGTVTVGELATLLFGTGPANEFTGSIFVVTGKQDAIVCNGLLGADCGSGENSIPARAGAFFPNAADYSVHIPDNTGHNANIHFSSPDSFKRISAYLESRGF